MKMCDRAVRAEKFPVFRESLACCFHAIVCCFHQLLHTPPSRWLQVPLRHWRSGSHDPCDGDFAGISSMLSTVLLPCTITEPIPAPCTRPAQSWHCRCGSQLPTYDKIVCASVSSSKRGSPGLMCALASIKQRLHDHAEFSVIQSSSFSAHL